MNHVKNREVTTSDVTQILRAVILNGSLKNQTQLEPVQETLEVELRSGGWSVESILLHELDIRSCTGCFRCWNVTPGICTGVKDDDAEEITEKVINSDLLVFLTPLTFGGYSSELKKGLDHLIGLISPFFMKATGETHHKPRYPSYPRLIGVGVLPGPDSESEQIFTTLVGRNALNLHAPAHAAGVIRSGDSREAVGEAIRSLLAAAGVDH